MSAKESENLVLQNPRDELLVKIDSFRKEKKLHKKELKLASQIKNWHYVYGRSFVLLAERYFKIDRDFLKNLSDKDLKELAELILIKAKRSRLWEIPIYHALGILTIPLMGLGFAIIHDIWDRNDYDFCVNKFALLHKWYWENHDFKELRNRF